MSCDNCPGVGAVHHLCGKCVQDDSAREEARVKELESQIKQLKSRANKAESRNREYLTEIQHLKAQLRK